MEPCKSSAVKAMKARGLPGARSSDNSVTSSGFMASCAEEPHCKYGLVF